MKPKFTPGELGDSEIKKELGFPWAWCDSKHSAGALLIIQHCSVCWAEKGGSGGLISWEQGGHEASDVESLDRAHLIPVFVLHGAHQLMIFFSVAINIVF